VYSDSEEGRKYSQYYGVDGWPYIAILDPRTGSVQFSLLNHHILIPEASFISTVILYCITLHYI